MPRIDESVRTPMPGERPPRYTGRGPKYLPRSGLLERSLCGPGGYVASSRSMPRIQPILDPERHITVASQTRTAQAWPGHVSLAMTIVGLGVDRRIRASSCANGRVDGQASGNAVQERRRAQGLPSGAGTRSVMWPSICARFEETGRRSDRRHITALAT